MSEVVVSAVEVVPHICKNCESRTVDITTYKMYCMNVSGLRLMLLGPRLVLPTQTCSKCVIRKQLLERSR